MDEKTLMEDLLLTVKGACDLYLHGAIESGTQNVHCAFTQGLQDTLAMQNQIYSQMSQRGWYQTTQAEQPKIDQAIQKFSMQAQQN
ncbi:MAG TPA: spore coat protein [Clostridiales bacterium]|jgi:spore coat protein CotF|nr:spore coat protein [Clostridiales bacterium]